MRHKGYLYLANRLPQPFKFIFLTYRHLGLFVLAFLAMFHEFQFSVGRKQTDNQPKQIVVSHLNPCLSQYFWIFSDMKPKSWFKFNSDSV